MTPGMTQGPLMTLGAVLTGASCALLFGAGLSVLARPADLKDRLNVLDGQAERAQALLRRRGGSHDYPPGSVCAGVAPAQLEPVRQRFSALATVTPGQPARVQLTPSAPADLERIAPVSVRIEAEGEYAPMLSALDALSRSQPLLYADVVELRPHDHLVSLQFSGRFYCWTAAPR
ncbi:MAG: hypothetical protein J7521_16865 [Caulobacter sp.]|nr:hypothetical protein [Caulobacter sp.]